MRAKNPSALFPAACCSTCERTVLTCLVLGAEGEETRCCAHCGQPITSELQWLGAGDVEELGYYFGAPPRACGCGSGGCGSRWRPPLSD